VHRSDERRAVCEAFGLTTARDNGEGPPARASTTVLLARVTARAASDSCDGVGRHETTDIPSFKVAFAPISKQFVSNHILPETLILALAR
jgi:hypothetical protein